ncbi:MAG: iolC [Myxococcales bacterium]|nr:iolC [Myxococcales bacterium]
MSTSDEAVVVWGEVLWDRFISGSGDVAHLGGAPANVAWHLGQAGGWARLVTRVGDDEDGRLAIARLSELVDPSLIQIDPERATGEVTIEVVEGEPRYTMHHGRAWERIECTPAVKLALAEAGVLIFGTLSQLTPGGLAQWRAAVAAAHATCLKVCDVNLRRTTGGILNPGGEPPGELRGERLAVWEAIAAADVIKVNDRELAAIGAWLGWSDPIAHLRDRREPARSRRDALDIGAPPSEITPRIVVVTHGDAGSTLYGDGPPIAIEGVRGRPGGDNVGCGDAYLAILVLCMTMGWDLEMSGRAASRYAAAVAGVRGATPLFTEEHVAELMEPA